MKEEETQKKTSDCTSTLDEDKILSHIAWNLSTVDAIGPLFMFLK